MREWVSADPPLPTMHLAWNFAATLIFCMSCVVVSWRFSKMSRGNTYTTRSSRYTNAYNVTENPPPPRVVFVERPAPPVNSAEYLYTTDGNSHIPLDILRSERLAPLTKWVQAEIFRHQNPADCAGSKFLVTNGWDYGLGSEMHVTGSHLAHAIQTNRILVWGQSPCYKFANTNECNRGCPCLFKELSNCSKQDAGKWDTVGGTEFYHLVPDMFRSAMLSKIPSLTDEELLYWWRAQSVAFLMRFNDETVMDLREMRNMSELHYISGGGPVPFPLPPGTVNAHIRHGDKYTEMTLVPSDIYVQAFKAMIRNTPNTFSRVLFVSSDDEEAVQTCRGLTESLSMTYIYTKLQRMEGGHHITRWGSMRAGQERKLIIGHLLQLVMALEADAWIGTRGSNWNRLIDELRCVWVDKCHHGFVEVGGPDLNQPDSRVPWSH